MRYEITRRVLGLKASVDLTEPEYRDAVIAQEGLFAALGIEQKYDLLLSNYEELERDLLNIALHRQLYADLSWASLTDHRHLLNRRLANLLSACRMYIDQTHHDIRGIYGGAHEVIAAADALFHTQYDALLEYRVMEALRNQVQHRSLPVHTISIKHTVIGEEMNEEGRRGPIRNTCEISLSVEHIAEQGNFKAKVLDELRDLARKLRNDQVDLKPIIRNYIAALGAIHGALRLQLKGQITKWETIVEQCFKRFKQQYGDDVSGLAVVMRGADGRILEFASLFEDFITYRRELEEKNRHIHLLANGFVSNEVIGRR